MLKNIVQFFVANPVLHFFRSAPVKVPNFIVGLQGVIVPFFRPQKGPSTLLSIFERD
jgi:hypothetical protein